jgi:multidrug efflux system membrane fusion protein
MDTAARGLTSVLTLTLALLVACAKDSPQEARLRAVRIATVADGHLVLRTYSGEVRPRYESKLGFRVGGKVLARHVDVGDVVPAGSVLAEIDPEDLRHARTSLAAQLAAARMERQLAGDELQRHRDLLAQRLISPAEIERRNTAFEVAVDRVDTLEAQLAQAANQVAYAKLRADHPGVVTALGLEVGQVVSAGQHVATLARQGEREVLINVPEQQLVDVRKGQAAGVAFAANAGHIKGRVREISPAAEPGSRTYAIRVTLIEAPAWVALGMTASVVLESPGSSLPVVPLAAVFEPQNAPHAGPRVWVFDKDTRSVKSVPVRLGNMLAGERVELSGLQPGMQVVTAGVHWLHEGQTVRVLGDEAPVRTRARSGG